MGRVSGDGFLLDGAELGQEAIHSFWIIIWRCSCPCVRRALGLLLCPLVVLFTGSVHGESEKEFTYSSLTCERVNQSVCKRGRE